MDMDLKGFLMWHKGNADGYVTTDSGRDLTGRELRAYCRWGVSNGYELLSELPEFEEVEQRMKEEGFL